MGSQPVTECGSCRSRDLECVLQLAPTPPTCSMLKIGDTKTQERYPLDLLRCPVCTLVQLSCIVDPDEVFPAEYLYSSGNSRALHEHFADLARHADEQASLSPQDLVVDIGANDGTLLSKFLGRCRTVGVEPTGQARRIAGPYYQEFFTIKLAERIVAEHGQAKVVTACNVLAHVPDPHEFLEAVRVLLADDGVFITENGALQAILDGGWDFIYHEHLRYYDPYSVEQLLVQHGFVPWEHETLAIHGGSFRTISMIGGERSQPQAQEHDGWHRAFKRLREDVKRNRWYMRSLMSVLGGMGERVGAIGATARATTLLNAYGFDATDVQAVYEVPTSDKIGHYIPGTNIPVIDEAALTGPDAPENVLLLLWYMEDRLVPKLRELGYQGNIIVPLPKWHEHKPELAVA